MAITRINNLGITDGTIVNADISASAAIASTKLSGVNDAKAWVNFNGTGTVAIRASFNVSSITDNAVGTYTVNFTTAISDANYSVVITGQATANTDNGIAYISNESGASFTTTALSIRTGVEVAYLNTDLPTVCVAVFR